MMLVCMFEGFFKVLHSEPMATRHPMVHTLYRYLQENVITSEKVQKSTHQENVDILSTEIRFPQSEAETVPSSDDDQPKRVCSAAIQNTYH